MRKLGIDRGYHLARHGCPQVLPVQAEDRLLQISDGPSTNGSSNFVSDSPVDTASSDLLVHHLKPPPSYIAANWPLQSAALSPDGVDVAVAGRRGLALFSRRSSRWRLFGDVSQEKGLAVHVSILHHSSSSCKNLKI